MIKTNFKMSVEPHRTMAYNPDIRWRMVYQRVVLDLPFRTISQNLCVDVSTVRRTVTLFINTNSVDKQLIMEINEEYSLGLTNF